MQRNYTGTGWNRKKCAEDVLKGQIPTEGYGIDDAVAFMDLLKLKHLRNRLVDYIICGQVWQWGNGEIIKVIRPGKNLHLYFIVIVDITTERR